MRPKARVHPSSAVPGRRPPPSANPTSQMRRADSNRQTRFVQSNMILGGGEEAHKTLLSSHSLISKPSLKDVVRTAGDQIQAILSETDVNESLKHKLARLRSNLSSANLNEDLVGPNLLSGTASETRKSTISPKGMCQHTLQDLFLQAIESLFKQRQLDAHAQGKQASPTRQFALLSAA